jgi:hypothetical protein
MRIHGHKAVFGAMGKRLAPCLKRERFAASVQTVQKDTMICYQSKRISVFQSVNHKITWVRIPHAQKGIGRVVKDN